MPAILTEQLVDSARLSAETPQCALYQPCRYAVPGLKRVADPGQLTSHSTCIQNMPGPTCLAVVHVCNRLNTHKVLVAKGQHSGHGGVLRHVGFATCALRWRAAVEVMLQSSLASLHVIASSRYAGPVYLIGWSNQCLVHKSVYTRLRAQAPSVHTTVVSCCNPHISVTRSITQLDDQP